MAPVTSPTLHCRAAGPSRSTTHVASDGLDRRGCRRHWVRPAFWSQAERQPVGRERGRQGAADHEAVEAPARHRVDPGLGALGQLVDDSGRGHALIRQLLGRRPPPSRRTTRAATPGGSGATPRTRPSGVWRRRGRDCGHPSVAPSRFGDVRADAPTVAARHHAPFVHRRQRRCSMNSARSSALESTLATNRSAPPSKPCCTSFSASPSSLSIP